MSIERNGRNSFINKVEDATENQMTVTAVYKRISKGPNVPDVELITFRHRIGGGEVVFICNIPQELYPEEDRYVSDRDPKSAPVYAKFKVRRPGPDDERALVNNPEDPTEAQITLTGWLRQGRGGHEVFSFVLRLGMFEQVYIVNIPQILYSEEDRFESERPLEESPVYIKTKIVNNSGNIDAGDVLGRATTRPC